MNANGPESSEGHTPSGHTGGEEIERLRETCPVTSEHKAAFPAAPWRWQPAAASWVWAVLKEAGGAMHGKDLIGRLAELRGWSRRQANGLRNRGLFVLEAFGLVEIERPAGRGERGPHAAYGRVEIVKEQIDGDEGEEGDDYDIAVEVELLKTLYPEFAADLLRALVNKGIGFKRKRVGADETVCLELTEEQRALLAEPTIFFLDSDLDEEVERERRAHDGLHFTLDQLDRFGGLHCGTCQPRAGCGD